MKHLLILLIILLLSPPLFGNSKKGETLYFWETSSGLSWKGFGDKKFHPKYQGDVVSSKPNGLGILTYPWGSKYVGEWKDGRLWNGIGYDKKANIIGKYVNGVNRIKEPVELVDKEPVELVGERQTGILFRRGESRQWRPFRNGKNINDRIYVGDIRNGEPNGQGTHISPNGDKYVGKFKDGEYHGQGTYTFHDGAKYVGEFKEGRVWNGKVYNGNFKYKIVNGN